MITSRAVSGPTSPVNVDARPSDLAERQLFFARPEAEDVAASWRSHKLTLLYGHAGTGKTALLRDGIVPKIHEEDGQLLPIGEVWRRLIFPAGAFPEQNYFTLSVLSSWFPDIPITNVAGRSISEFLRKQSRTDKFGHTRPTLAAIDRLDLLFRQPVPDAPLRRRFLAQLGAAISELPNLRLLLVLREEFLDETLQFAASCGEDSIATYALGTFDRKTALDAIGPRSPAADSLWPADTPERIVDELRTVRTPWGRPRAVPRVDPKMLQSVYVRLLPSPHGDPVPTAEQLPELVDRLLGEQCEQALALVAADHQVGTPELITWFRRTFAQQVGGGRVRMSDIVGPFPDSVIRALEDMHLIKARKEIDGPCFELRHPRLIGPVSRMRTSPAVPMRRPEPSTRLRIAELLLCDDLTHIARYHAEAVVRACRKHELRIVAEAEQLLGNIDYRLQRPDSAKAHYRQAAEIYEALGDSHAVGLLLAAIGQLVMAVDPPQAVRELRAAANLRPNDLAIQVVLSQSLWQAGQSRAALAVLDGVLARDGDTAEALRNRGEMLADLGHTQHALRDLDRIDHRTRPSTHAAWTLAVTLQERSVQEHDASLFKNSESGPVLLRLARTHEYKGERERAAELAERALAARHPPLPPQLREVGHGLLSSTAASRWQS